jgi:hypothetical protein
VPSTTLSASKSTGVISGRYYRVRYRAKNIVGFGEYSDTSYILAATIPETPSAPVTSISGSNLKV